MRSYQHDPGESQVDDRVTVAQSPSGIWVVYLDGVQRFVTVDQQSAEEAARWLREDTQ